MNTWINKLICGIFGHNWCDHIGHLEDNGTREHWHNCNSCGSRIKLESLRCTPLPRNTFLTLYQPGKACMCHDTVNCGMECKEELKAQLAAAKAEIAELKKQLQDKEV
jgi:hypothetical protein